MTRFTLELVAVDDRAAMCLMRMLMKDMLDSYVSKNTATPLAPAYGVSDTDGSVECKVTREDNGIERGMEVTP